MNTKTDGISSGLLASIYLAFSDDGENIRFWTSNAFHAVEWAQENWETEAFVRLSDAEAIIAQQSERIKELESDVDEEAHIRDRMAKLLAETAVALKGPEKALHRHGWQDLPEVAAKQSAALKLARSAIDAHLNPCGCSNGCEFCSGKVYLSEALAAIDSLLKGE